jgi:hypothetical protein
MGFTFATHFCGGHAVQSELGFGDHHLDCGMATMDVQEKEEPENEPVFTTDCCQNLVYQLDITDDYQSTLEQITVNPVFTVAFVYTFFTNDFPLIKGQNYYTNYTPHPLIKQDVQVLFQSFLI